MQKNKEIKWKQLSGEEALKFSIKTAPRCNKLWFNVDEIVIQCGKLQLELPEFWKLEDIEELVFKFPEKTHIFKRVEEK